jgi:hypothetical protein
MTQRSICFPALPGALARAPVFPPLPVEVSSEFVVLAGLKLCQQLLDILLNLAEFRNERLAVRYRVIKCTV